MTSKDLVERLREAGAQLLGIAAGYGDKKKTRPYRDGNLMNEAASALEVARVALEELGEVTPKLPAVHQWAGQEDAEDLFDAGLRHKNGKKPYDYLMTWLNMLRPFACATKDDSWGEMEKLLCIVMRNYVRMIAASDRARRTLSQLRGET